MRDDYKIQDPTQKIEITVETKVAERLRDMEKHTKHTLSELANTALKRFIAHHKDFLPRDKGGI